MLIKAPRCVTETIIFDGCLNTKKKLYLYIILMNVANNHSDNNYYLHHLKLKQKLRLSLELEDFKSLLM